MEAGLKDMAGQAESSGCYEPLSLDAVSGGGGVILGSADWPEDPGKKKKQYRSPYLDGKC